MGFGDYSVSELQHLSLKLSDGVELGLRFRIPVDFGSKSNFDQLIQEATQFDQPLLIYKGTKPGEEVVFPVILEFLPYCKDTRTLPRDHARHSRMASHGFVCVRADCRGTGTSDGFIYDEYEAQELEDGVELIDWLAQQPWSNGRVGMFGKSWGGNNGLQIASRAPGPLETIVSLNSTDNRFTDDIHYMGGCVIGNGMLAWSSQMLLWNSKPPYPKYCRDWKSFWIRRLENSTKSWSETWLRNQSPNSYWANGSVHDQLHRIQCPILLFGGTADGYTNAAFRLAAGLNDRSKIIIGPWSHDWPDTSVPGPNIDFLELCIQWFNYHLKSAKESTVSNWKRMRVFVKEDLWTTLPNWPRIYNEYQLVKKNSNKSNSDSLQTLTFDIDLKNDKYRGIVEIKKPHPLQGFGGGEWMGTTTADQTVSNSESQVWISEPLEKDIVLIGFSGLKSIATVTAEGVYSLAVRLCDYLPNGKIVRVTYGLHRFPVTQRDIKDGNEFDIWVELKATAYRLEKGHRIGVAISRSYFPIMFPTMGNGSVFLDTGNTQLFLQRPEHLPIQSEFSPPKPLLALAESQLTPASALMKDLERYEYRNQYIAAVSQDSGQVRYPNLEMSTSETSETIYSIDESENAKVECYRTMRMDFPENRTKVETSSEMGSEKGTFLLSEEVRVKLNDELIFQRKCDHVIPRTDA